VEEPERSLKDQRGLFLLRLRLRLVHHHRLDELPETAGPGEGQVACHGVDAALWLRKSDRRERKTRAIVGWSQ
jgi:hypothetical protein